MVVTEYSCHTQGFLVHDVDCMVLSEASSVVGKVNDGLDSFTSATGEQSAVAADVNRHMADIAVVTTENTRSMEDSAQETRNLEVQAESLQVCASRFRTE